MNKLFKSLHFLCKLRRTNSSFYLATLTHHRYYLSPTHIHTFNQKILSQLRSDNKKGGNTQKTEKGQFGGGKKGVHAKKF